MYQLKICYKFVLSCYILIENILNSTDPNKSLKQISTKDYFFMFVKMVILLCYNLMFSKIHFTLTLDHGTKLKEQITGQSQYNHSFVWSPHSLEDNLMTESEPDNSPPHRPRSRSQGVSGQCCIAGWDGAAAAGAAWPL